MNEPQTRPDFVIAGQRLNAETVSLIASTSISEASLDYEADTEEVGDLFGPIRYIATSHRYTLTAVFDRYVVITAPSYVEAFRALFRQWAPPEAKPGELEAGRLEIRP